MGLLNGADALRIGGLDADRAFLGGTPAWAPPYDFASQGLGLFDEESALFDTFSGTEPNWQVSAPEWSGERTSSTSARLDLRGLRSFSASLSVAVSPDSESDAFVFMTLGNGSLIALTSSSTPVGQSSTHLLSGPIPPDVSSGGKLSIAVRSSEDDSLLRVSGVTLFDLSAVY